MSLSHWDWRVNGCCLEGLDSRNCLAGLRDVYAPLGVAAGLLEEVSYEILVLQTLTCEFWRKSRTKRSFLTFGGSLVRNARFGDLTRDFWRKSRTKRSFWRLDA